MTDCAALRAAISGLVGFAADAEASLLAAAGPGAAIGDGPLRWTAVAAVAHITEFKRQQVQRLQAVLDAATPPAFGDIDHASAPVYERYARQPADVVAAASRRTAGQLTGALSAVCDEDLTDPLRNPWLAGRQLWLQIIVRGFWHPAGHIGEYYLSHQQPAAALALHSRAVATARELAAPAAARGMASYGLACAQARAGQPDGAFASIRQAISLNPDLRASAARDPDLAGLRDGGQLAAVLA
jgi:hypothetical protein